MSTRQASADSPPIGSKADLVAWIAKGQKPKANWRIGTEHEKFLFLADTLTPVAYDGPRGIRAIFGELISRYGWQPIMEGDAMIALKRPDGDVGGTVSLEPGGQFELSGAPLATLHEVHAETVEHIDQMKAISADLGITMLGMGFTPEATRSEIPRMPKRRYAVMTRYMPQVGAMGLDMMYRTSTVQVNLDFASESDMTQKLRVSLALQPIAQALFASSPFTEGKPNGFQTMRGEVWRDTDRNRTGNLPFAFEPGIGFERYVDYALDVPMYFVYRDEQYIDVAGASFRDFLSGKLQNTHPDPRLKGLVATMEDWSDHVTTLFPDARVKRFIEMRGADSGSLDMIVALPAFWVGLLYDQVALDAAYDLVKGWSREDRDHLRNGVPKGGLKATVAGRSVLEIARDAVRISEAGLKARGLRDASGRDESRHLAPVLDIVKSGHTVSDRLLAKYAGAWGQSVRPIYRDEAL
jgi:glutamate--cysteine ligase